MRYLIYLILAISTSLTAGTIHKWIDEDGNVHYGDTPPVSSKTESVRVLSKPSNPGKALPRLTSPENAEQAAGQQQKQASAEQAKIVCENARQDLQVINNTSRIRLKEPDGTTRFLTAEEISERKAQTEADIAKYCN